MVRSSYSIVEGSKGAHFSFIVLSSFTVVVDMFVIFVPAHFSHLDTIMNILFYSHRTMQMILFKMNNRKFNEWQGVYRRWVRVCGWVWVDVWVGACARAPAGGGGSVVFSSRSPKTRSP
jgi:hypothetical protein